MSDPANRVADAVAVSVVVVWPRARPKKRVKAPLAVLSRRTVTLIVFGYPEGAVEAV